MLMSGTLFKIFYVLIWTNLCFRSSYASVLTIMAFSLERYIAICRPLQALPWSDCTRVSGVSSLCWFLAMLFSLPHLLFTKETHIIFKAEAQWSYARMPRWKTRKKERKKACSSWCARPPPPVLVAAPVPLAALLGPESLFF